MTQLINVWQLMHALMLDSSSILLYLMCTGLQGFAVQSSYKLNLPPHLIIHSSNIKMTETIGQGKLIIILLLFFALMSPRKIISICVTFQGNLVWFTKDIF